MILTTFKEDYSSSGSNSRDSKINLLNLPYLALENVLDHLDAPSLKNLRTVSHQAKNLVEQPIHLKKLVISIPDENRISALQSSQINWSNIIVSGQICEEFTNEFVQFLQKCRPYLFALEIQHDTVSPEKIITLLLNVGPILKSLTFNCGLEELELDTESPFPQPQYRRIDPIITVKKYKRLLEESRDELEKNLVGLRNILFPNNLWRNQHDPATCLLIELLQYCPNLERINVPMIQEKSGDDSDDSKEKKCAPLLAYLERITSLNGGKFLSKIDFCFNMSWDVCSVRHFNPIFPLTPSILLRLVHLCEPIQVKLFNVPSVALPNPTFLPNRQKELLNKCVASILCINEYNGISGGFIPPNASIVAMIFVNEHTNYSRFEIPESANVVTMIVNGETSEGNETTDQMLRNLLCVFRPTVTRLEIVVQEHFVDLVRRLGPFFPNLEQLYLHEFTFSGNHSGGLDLTGLSELVNVTLESCTFQRSNERMTIGALFSQAQKLKRVVLSDCIVKTGQHSYSIVNASASRSQPPI